MPPIRNRKGSKEADCRDAALQDPSENFDQRLSEDPDPLSTGIRSFYYRGPNTSRPPGHRPGAVFDELACICKSIYVFDIRFAESVEEDLRKIQVYYRNQILDAIEEQLAHEPETVARNRKLLENLTPPWQTVAPVWELRVGEYRVFYDVSGAESVVYVRAIRKKPRGTKTEDIL